MQFQNIAIVIFALAILLFLFVRRQVITGLKADNAQLRNDHERMRAVCVRQRDEITKLIQAAEDERRARQFATLSAVGVQGMSKTPTAPPLAKKQHSAARTPAKREEEQANRWNDPGKVTMAVRPGRIRPAPAAAAVHPVIAGRPAVPTVVAAAAAINAPRWAWCR